MILGTGIDIVEIGRIAKALNNPRFIERVFTSGERDYCEAKQGQKASSYAARFAAKEAVMKAFGTGLSRGSWLDIEVWADHAGKPSVRLSGFFAAIAREIGATEIHISLSHSREYAVAQALIWGGERRALSNRS